MQTTRKEAYYRDKNDKSTEADNHETDLKRKLALDPLVRINSDLNIKTKSKKSKKKHRNEDEERKKKLKVEDSVVSQSKPSKTIEQLRAER